MPKSIKERKTLCAFAVPFYSGRTGIHFLSSYKDRLPRKNLADAATYRLKGSLVGVNVIELTEYNLDAKVTGRPFKPFDFSLARGDVCHLSTDSVDDALTFLKALATLIRPLQGAYRYKGEVLNLSDFRCLLPLKKKIGFITSHSALISNRSIRENLLLMQSYYSNTYFLELDEKTREYCELFSIQKMMDQRPVDLAARQCHLAITIRELAKSPEVLLLENPEDFIGLSNFGIFWDVFAKQVEEKLPVVFLSNSKSFIQSFANRKLVILQETLTEP
jgi:ABC-type lipoprotein export system ATPase subunit